MNKPVLITGIHRSGSTWLGEMISLSPDVGYIHEPFNYNHGKCICGYSLNYWYESVTPVREEMFKKHFDHLLKFGYQEVVSDISKGKFRKVGVQWRRGQIDLLSQLKSHRPLVKDPLALMSADWIHETFSSQNVVSIRHPAAFVDSLIRKKWTFDFGNFGNQPELMAGKLSAWAPQIRDYTNRSVSLQEQAVLLWNIIYDVVSQYREKYPDWYYIRHEDVSLNPKDELRKLYDYLGLKFTAEIETEVERFTNPTKENTRQRNSRDNILRWQNNLSPEQIRVIREDTAAVAERFYSSSDW